MKSFREINESEEKSVATYRSKSGEELEIDFDPAAKLEINLGKDVDWGKMPGKDEKDTWVGVDVDTFRSWGGERKVDGEVFTGKVYNNLSNEVADISKAHVKAGDKFIMTFPNSEYIQRNGSQPTVVTKGDKIRIAKPNADGEGNHLAYKGMEAFYINDDELVKFKPDNE